MFFFVFYLVFQLLTKVVLFKHALLKYVKCKLTSKHPKIEQQTNKKYAETNM